MCSKIEDNCKLSMAAKFNGMQKMAYVVPIFQFLGSNNLDTVHLALEYLLTIDEYL